MYIAKETDLGAARVDPTSLGRRVLAFAPHPDDEVFGCGGILCLLAATGAAISVIIVSDGALGGDAAQLVELREAESCRAAQVLGYPQPAFWRHPDRGVRYGDALVTKMQAAIEAFQAESVLAPGITELHPDHQVVAIAAAEAVRRVGGDVRLACYEISAPLTPNCLIDITAVESRKLEAMRCFNSQLDEQPYVERIAGFNRYRGYPLGPKVLAAEGLLCIAANEIGSGYAALFESVPMRRRRLGFAVDAGDIPMVSVVIRSMDRDTLGATLDSVALQTYDNVEVVVINAKGGPHIDLGNHCGRFPLRVVNQDGEPLSRPKAANAGLDSTRGAYLAILDDDDTLDPDHLSHLIAALQGESEAVVVFAGVRCIDRGDPGRKVSRIFGEPLESLAQLLAGNFIPVHAPLFPRGMLEHARFDETLETYEDWDFWLQLASRSRFVYSGRVTATYFTGGTSGVSPQRPDWAAVRQATRALYAKWMRVTPDEFGEIGKLYHRARAELANCQADVRRLSQEMAEISMRHDAAVGGSAQLHSETGTIDTASAKEELAETRRQLDTARAQLAEMLSSTSWRLTGPMRRLKTVGSGLVRYSRKRRA